MGVVYEAEQESLGRRVALKVLSASSLLDPKQVIRFEREAKAAARLHHTNIVPVFGVGSQEGHHYFVMQFIAGLGLDVVLDDLRKLRGGKSEGKPQAASSRVARLTAADVARSLITGQFAADGPPGDGSRTEPFDDPAPPSQTAIRLMASLPPQSGPARRRCRRRPTPTVNTIAAWRGSACRWPRRSSTPTARERCIATSSRRTCFWTITAASGWRISGWPRPPAPTT